jgi:hypothetical protein
MKLLFWSVFASLALAATTVPVQATTVESKAPPAAPVVKPATGSAPVTEPKKYNDDNPMPYSLAVEIFNAMAARADIAFKCVEDGCYARAHLMAKAIVEQFDAEPGKVWSMADPEHRAEGLKVTSPNHPAGGTEWGWHVAVTVPVRGDDGVVQDMVIDPSLFTRPCTITEWKNAQRKHWDSEPYICRTRLGEAPKDRYGHKGQGPGYLPFDYPRDLNGNIVDVDKHATDTMARYKHYEGKSLSDLAA